MKPFSFYQFHTSLFCSFFGVALVGCTGGRSAESAAPAGAPAPKASPSSVEGEADASAAEEEAVVDNKSELRGEPTTDAEDGESSDDFDDGSDGTLKPLAPKGSTPQEKKKSLASELHTEVLQLEKALQPQALSCEAALPHKKSICSIAERICEMEAPSTARSSDCENAQQSCKKAQKRYHEKCE